MMSVRVHEKTEGTEETDSQEKRRNGDPNVLSAYSFLLLIRFLRNLRSPPT